MTTGDRPTAGPSNPGLADRTGTRPRADPPPPGQAQRLVAAAGVAVYEGGHSIFSEPVLVYLGVRHGRATAFKICDHIEAPLGYSKPRPTSWLTGRAPVQIHDPWDAPLLQARWRSAMFQHAFTVNGVASAGFTVPTFGGGEMTIGRDREPFGYVTGFGLNGRRQKHMEVLDHDRRPVAKLTAFEERPSFLRRNVHYVMSINPDLGGELRRLVIAVPIIAEMIRERLDSQ